MEKSTNFIIAIFSLVDVCNYVKIVLSGAGN